MKYLRNAQGFTLIELMVVMTVIVVLATMGMVGYRNSVRRAEEAVLKENLFRMRDAMDQFYADKNKWPSDLTEQAEPDSNNPGSGGGIDNVFSGSTETALDGSQYSEWG
jgi:general secretion pathway protein G